MGYLRAVRRGALVALAVISCSGGRAAPVLPAPPPPVVMDAGAAPPPPGGPDAAAPAVDERAPLDEASARVALAARFRAAGLRIREDVRLAGTGYELTVDGFDPERGVGYEYDAAGERGSDLGDGEADALARDPALRILVLAACAPPELEAQAARFLAALSSPAP
jgi:hypothetical protein